MTRIVVDELMRARLAGLSDQVELCDESGHVLGRFIPGIEVRDESGRALGRFLPAPSADADGCPYSAEELRRFQQETGGRPLADVWKDLGRA